MNLHEIRMAGIRAAEDAVVRDLEKSGLAALTGAQPAPAAPSGYKLVPLEPTPDMVTRAENVVNDPIMQVYRDEIADVYRAMLSAAPAAQPADSARQKSIREDFELIADAHMQVFGMAHSPAREQAWDALKTALERNMNRG